MKFKRRKDMSLFFALHPALIMIYADLYWYSKNKHDVELVITSTVSNPIKDKLLGRVSNSHSQHRALDIRTKDLDAFVVQDICDYINYKDEYEEFRYLSSSGVYRLAFLHTTNAPHIHLSIHSKYAIK